VLLSNETFSGRLVEQMDQVPIRLEPNLVARLELMTFAKHGDDLFTAEFGENLSF
jgi:hypothetical protein